MKHIEVAAAVIVRAVHESVSGKKQTEIFCAQRPRRYADDGTKTETETSGKWEFPGGKIELGETASQALVREIREEMDTQIHVGDFLCTVEHQYKTFFLTMHAFLCTICPAKPLLGETATLPTVTKLTEHLDSCWLPVSRLGELDWAAADLPIVQKLQEISAFPDETTRTTNFPW